MQFVTKEQSEQNAIRDRITASMETGNHGQARTLLTELADTHPELADSIRLDVVSEYGISL